MDTAIGIDFGGTNTKLALVSKKGNIIKKLSFKTKSPFEKKEWVKSLGRELKILKKSGLLKNAAGIGIGVAGLVDPDKNIVLHAPNISGIDGWKMGSELKAYFNMPVKIDNDVNAIALGENYFINDNSKNIIVITLGTGVGGGIIIKGKLYRGTNFTAGELGHITINEKGPLCGCGNRGCVEAYIGNRRIVSRYKELVERSADKKGKNFVNKFKNISPQEIYELAKNGDKISLKVWEETAMHLATMLASIINFINPDKIIIGGGVSNAFDIMEEYLWKNLRKRALKDALSGLSIEKSLLGSDAGVIGAASLIFQQRI